MPANFRRLCRCALAMLSAAAMLVPAVDASSGVARAKSGFDHQRLANASLEKFIRPGYARFTSAIADMNAVVGQLCQSASTAQLAAARAAFRASVAAWGRVEFITFGPVGEANRLERILFWPDRKGIGARQVRRLLFNKTARAQDPAQLAKMSVAVQGLGALETVLFANGSDDLAKPNAAAFRCGYALAITRNLRDIAEVIASEWAPSGAFAKLWLAAGPDNPVYLSGRETTHELAKLVNQCLDTIVERRLEPIAGIGGSQRVRRPILSRSRLTLVLVAANVAGLRALMFDGGVMDVVKVQASGDHEVLSVMKSAGTELSLALSLLRPLAQEPDLLAHAGGRRKLVPVIFALKNVRENAVGALRSAAGLSLGFNASDGD
jgi:uncharacterized protein